MLKGAFIFAAGAAAGLAVGTINGLILGFKTSESIKKVSIGTPPEENMDRDIVIGQADAT